MVGRKQTWDTGEGCCESNLGSASFGLQRVMRPSARPIARMALSPEVELNDNEVTCEEPWGTVRESGNFVREVTRDSDQR